MARMVRKQVYIEPWQDAALKRRAGELGVVEAELIRRGIEHVIRGHVALPPDLKAWEEEKEFIRQRMEMNVPQTGRTWRREELYEERLQRFSR